MIEQLEAEFETAKRKLITAYLQKVSEIELLDAVRAVISNEQASYGGLDEILAITVTFYDSDNNETSFDTSELIDNEEVDECLVPIMYIAPQMVDTEFNLTNKLSSKQ